MKKFLILILVLALTLSTFVACSNTEKDPEVTTNAPEGTTEPEETTTGEAETEEGELGDPTPLEDAIAYIHQLYKDNIAETIANYDLVKSVTIEDETFAVVWTIVGTDLVTIVDKDDTMVTVVVPEQGDADIAYKIKATITSGDETVTREYDRVVPRFAVDTHEEYMAAKQDDVLTIQGIVVAMNAKSAGNTRNHLFIADENVVGGYYIYQMEADPIETGIQVGMTVVVTGPASPYSGMMEIKGGQAKIVDTTIKTVDVVNITEAFAAGEDLAKYVGLPVTINGVTLTDQVLGGTSEYLNFELGEAQAYLRTYVTDFPTTLAADAKATIDELHASNRGNTADVTGILVLYSGNPYLIPMTVDGCITNIQQPERNDAEKAEFELGIITVAGKLTSDTTLTLPTVGSMYDNVAITWTCDNSELVVIDGGNVAITIPDEATDVVLTATAVCGSETKTATFTINLSKTLTPVKDAIEIGLSKADNTFDGDKYLVGGIITEVYNEQYGNMKITDENGNILTIYGTYSADGSTKYDAMDVKPVAGDYVVILGVIGQYSGTPQIKNGWIVTHKTTTSIEDAVTLGNTFEKNNYTEDKYLVTGTVKEIQNAQYGNIVIEDANGNSILVYGTYSATGVDRFDAMATQPKVGDTVTVYGIVGFYNAAQLKNAWIVNIVAGEEPAEEIPNISADGNGMMSPDTYRENGTVLKDGEAAAWILANRANGISGVDNIGFRGWAFLGDGINVTVADFGYALLKDGTEMSDITWGFAPIVDENIYAPLGGRTATRRYDITIDLTGLEAGEYDVFLYVKDADGNVYCLDGWVDVWVKVEAPVTPPVVEPEIPETEDTLTIPEALELGVANGDNTYTDEKYYVSGTVKNISNTMYGNMYIVDAEGNEILVYGTYSADGADRYDAMTAKPVAGDTITVYGIVGNYNGTPQLKNAWIIEFTHTHSYADATCDLPKTCACGATDGEANGHSYDNGSCTACGAIDPDAPATGDTTPVTASKTIAELITSEGWSNSTTKQSFKLDDIVSVKVDGGNNSGKAYGGNHIRIYATDTPAGTLTISVPEGYELVSVKVSADTGTYAFLCVDGSSTDIANETVEVSGTSVLLNSVKNGSDGKQVRVTAIEVVYKLVG